jgi:hypothetical protein
MADIHTFNCTWDQLWDVEVELTVDFDILTLEKAAEINAFWIDAEERLALCEGDVRAAVVRLAARFAIVTVISEWADEEAVNRALYDAEGWGDYDYNCIRITEVTGLMTPDFDEIKAEEIENG